MSSIKKLKAELATCERKRRYAWRYVFKLLDNEAALYYQIRELSNKVNQVEIPAHIKNMILEFSEKAKQVMECPICMEVMNAQKMTTLTKCGHLFHKECLDDVISRKCPICRHDLGRVQVT